MKSLFCAYCFKVIYELVWVWSRERGVGWSRKVSEGVEVVGREGWRSVVGEGDWELWGGKRDNLVGGGGKSHIGRVDTKRELRLGL